MDVHPTKNGINRYWSIPIYEITPASGLTNQGWYTSTRWVPWLDCKALQRICSGHWHRDPFSGHCSVRWCWQPPCGSRLWLPEADAGSGACNCVSPATVGTPIPHAFECPHRAWDCASRRCGHHGTLRPSQWGGLRECFEEPPYSVFFELRASSSCRCSSGATVRQLSNQRRWASWDSLRLHELSMRLRCLAFTSQMLLWLE